ncbi:uncharacterized protein [Mytilus edulis]|uniref:uncharacterized protein n=1 Tax=Mytilus edulis TaxID=6550 RepID=UPI0039EDF584
MATKAKSTKTNNNRSSKATTTVSTSSPDHEKVANGSKLPATSGSSTEFATSIERYVNTTQKFNAKTNDTKVLKHTFRTTHNQMHKTIGKCNCSAFYNPFGASKTVTGDTISTLKNINIPTHVMHINKTFMKNDSKIDKRKQKSQVASIAGSVTGVMFVICLVVLMVVVRRHMIRRDISKGKDRTTKSTSKNRSREGSNSFESQNNIPLYSSVYKLTKSEHGNTMPQSKSILNIGYDEAFEISVQNEDYDHIERIGRRTDVDMVYSLTSYQKSEDDYDISGNFNESLRSYQENSIYD